MKITRIELQNFRAFYNSHVIDLTKTGKNLLVYGENGAGKSSLFHALREFLFGQGRSLQQQRNIFADDDAVALIKLSVATKPNSPPDELTWSDKGNGPDNRRTEWNQTGERFILDAARTSGFLEYKGLLETYFLQIQNERVNIFDLLVNSLLKDMVDARTGRTLQDDWKEICAWLPRRHAKNVRAEFQTSLRSFNLRMARLLKDLEGTAEQILSLFKYRVDLRFKFEGVTIEYAPAKRLLGQSIQLDVKYFERPIERHHTFLNEAKLSALALAIYFAALLQTPHDAEKLNLLVLDDVLIGLDMANRLPIIDILETHFKDYQIFFLTYDRAWFEMMRLRTDNKWQGLEMFCGSFEDTELPVTKSTRTYLQGAEQYLAANDYKASVIYLRTAFEVMLKKFCTDRRIRVTYNDDAAKVSGNDFWLAAKEATGKNDEAYIDTATAKRIEHHRKFILNPISHGTIMSIQRKEVEEALNDIKELQTLLKKTT
jgi:hypothetical protein